MEDPCYIEEVPLQEAICGQENNTLLQIQRLRQLVRGASGIGLQRVELFFPLETFYSLVDNGLLEDFANYAVSYQEYPNRVRLNISWAIADVYGMGIGCEKLLFTDPAGNFLLIEEPVNCP